jgi:hypothetical protein
LSFVTICRISTAVCSPPSGVPGRQPADDDRKAGCIYDAQGSLSSVVIGFRGDTFVLGDRIFGCSVCPFEIPFGGETGHMSVTTDSLGTADVPASNPSLQGLDRVNFFLAGAMPVGFPYFFESNNIHLLSGATELFLAEPVRCTSFFDEVAGTGPFARTSNRKVFWSSPLRGCLIASLIGGGRPWFSLSKRFATAVLR